MLQVKVLFYGAATQPKELDLPLNAILSLPFPRSHIAANKWVAHGWCLELGSSPMLEQLIPSEDPCLHVCRLNSFSPAAGEKSTHQPGCLHRHGGNKQATTNPEPDAETSKVSHIPLRFSGFCSRPGACSIGRRKTAGQTPVLKNTKSPHRLLPNLQTTSTAGFFLPKPTPRGA